MRKQGRLFRRRRPLARLLRGRSGCIQVHTPLQPSQTPPPFSILDLSLSLPLSFWFPRPAAGPIDGPAHFWGRACLVVWSFAFVVPGIAILPAYSLRSHLSTRPGVLVGGTSSLLVPVGDSAVPASRCWAPRRWSADQFGSDDDSPPWASPALLMPPPPCVVSHVARSKVRSLALTLGRLGLATAVPVPC